MVERQEWEHCLTDERPIHGVRVVWSVCGHSVDGSGTISATPFSELTDRNIMERGYLDLLLTQIYQLNQLDSLVLVGLGVLLIRGFEDGMIAWARTNVSTRCSM